MESVLRLWLEELPLYCAVISSYKRRIPPLRTQHWWLIHSKFRWGLKTKSSRFVCLPCKMWTRSKISGRSWSGVYTRMNSDYRQRNHCERLAKLLQSLSLHPRSRNWQIRQTSGYMKSSVVMDPMSISRKLNTCSLMLYKYIDKYILKHDFPAWFTLKDILNQVKIHFIRLRLLPWVGSKLINFNIF